MLDLCPKISGMKNHSQKQHIGIWVLHYFYLFFAKVRRFFFFNFQPPEYKPTPMQQTTGTVNYKTLIPFLKQQNQQNMLRRALFLATRTSLSCHIYEACVACV